MDGQYRQAEKTVFWLGSVETDMFGIHRENNALCCSLRYQAFECSHTPSTQLVPKVIRAAQVIAWMRLLLV